ncbi:uncharacterized protein At1g28695-like [Coffea eugenioides]|uniref:uncharacterized protein At1g28695-like n=1 Tax=Coffea eugenioides TaxID=49369 RepID=UPI000F6132D7|nr:uncharacterized protein At1g28695-like [Coffea eugenioides]
MHHICTYLNNMDFSKKSINNLVLVSVVFTGLLFIFTWNPTALKSAIFSFQKHSTSQSNVPNVTMIRDELEAALSNAAMATDKTVIITIVNKAYVEPHNDQYPTMLDLFLEGFWVGEETRSLLDHLLVVAMDQTAYDRCSFRRLNCYRLLTDGVDFTEEKLYMSQDFIKMMWTRTRFLLDVLKRGYNFIFTDTDVIWLRNPFPRLRFNGTDDLQISTDNFNGNPRSQKNPINTGFYHIRANNKTITLFQIWYATRLNSTGLKEQDVLGNLIYKGVAAELGLNLRFLDTLYFSGFCRDSKDVRSVVTVHANCCRSISAKVADLTAVLKDWKRFKQSKLGASTAKRIAAQNTTNAVFKFKWSNHIACFKSWRKPSAN